MNYDRLLTIDTLRDRATLAFASAVFFHCAVGSRKRTSARAKKTSVSALKARRAQCGSVHVHARALVRRSARADVNARHGYMLHRT